MHDSKNENVALGAHVRHNWGSTGYQLDGRYTSSNPSLTVDGDAPASWGLQLYAQHFVSPQLHSDFASPGNNLNRHRLDKTESGVSQLPSF